MFKSAIKTLKWWHESWFTRHSDSWLFFPKSSKILQIPSEEVFGPPKGLLMLCLGVQNGPNKEFGRLRVSECFYGGFDSPKILFDPGTDESNTFEVIGICRMHQDAALWIYEEIWEKYIQSVDFQSWWRWLNITLSFAVRKRVGPGFRV